MTRPDIIFIVLDTQRADRLGCYHPARSLTPHIDRFAASAVLFEAAVSPAQWTIPSHASLFTGLYPTAHQLLQSNLSLGPDTPHVVEILRDEGYETVGFCNNPLVGVLDNGLKRGFNAFYNYAGTFPNRPQQDQLPLPARLKEKISGHLRRRLAGPIQNFFGRSDSAFSLSLNRWFTPMWSRWGNFKGQNEKSIADVVGYLDRREQEEREAPLFLFLNLMETHLPFHPPRRFVEKAAPQLTGNREAQRVMREWNSEAYRWSRPLPDGLTDLEWEVLNGYYDAEVAYQDDYLAGLFAALGRRANRRNTLTIIVGDHGDGLGEHNYFGHAFVAYQELLHVPLILHWPDELPAGRRIEQPVSTRRVFHTILEAAGRAPDTERAPVEAEIRALSLGEVVAGRDVEQGTAFAEVYPPLNFVKAMEDRQPELIERFRCRDIRRAIVQNEFKLIQIEAIPEELYDLTADALELDSILERERPLTARLNQQINRVVGVVEGQRDNLLAGVPLDIDQDPELIQHLRGLGYID